MKLICVLMTNINYIVQNVFNSNDYYPEFFLAMFCLYHFLLFVKFNFFTIIAHK